MSSFNLQFSRPKPLDRCYGGCCPAMVMIYGKPNRLALNYVNLTPPAAALPPIVINQSRFAVGVEVVVVAALSGAKLAKLCQGKGMRGNPSEPTPSDPKAKPKPSYCRNI